MELNTFLPTNYPEDPTFLFDFLYNEKINPSSQFCIHKEKQKNQQKNPGNCDKIK